MQQTIWIAPVTYHQVLTWFVCCYTIPYIYKVLRWNARQNGILANKKIPFLADQEILSTSISVTCMKSICHYINQWLVIDIKLLAVIVGTAENTGNINNQPNLVFMPHLCFFFCRTCSATKAFNSYCVLCKIPPLLLQNRFVPKMLLRTKFIFLKMDSFEKWCDLFFLFTFNSWFFKVI